jgi:hypothetical protein
MTSNTKHATRNDRIPAALQAIFLASNGGEEVHVPPPSNAAFKVFSILRRKNKKQAYDRPAKKVQVLAPVVDKVRRHNMPFLSIHVYFKINLKTDTILLLHSQQ